MRRLALGALLVVLPFSGIRVICIDSPVDVSGSTAPTETLTDCERLCPLQRPSDTPSITAGPSSSTKSDSDCALSPGASSISLSASIAVLRPHEPLQVPLAVSAAPAESPRFYLEPELAHLAPPPKLEAL